MFLPEFERTMIYTKKWLYPFIFYGILMSSCIHKTKPDPEFEPIRQTVNTDSIAEIKDSSQSEWIAGSLYFSPITDENYKTPHFKQGKKALAEFIRTNRKPVFHTVKDPVGVKFLVDTAGHLSGFRISTPINDCPACNEEALRIAKLMPDWEPGYRRKDNSFQKMLMGGFIWIPFDKVP